jgi:hypothetical protein
MIVRRVTTSAGTARELAEHADGYSANAESEYTRQAARGGAVHHQGMSVAELKKKLHRARVRASHHAEKLIRQRAGEDARELEAILRRIGVDTSGQYRQPQ